MPSENRKNNQERLIGGWQGPIYETTTADHFDSVGAAIDDDTLNRSPAELEAKSQCRPIQAALMVAG